MKRTIGVICVLIGTMCGVCNGAPEPAASVCWEPISLGIHGNDVEEFTEKMMRLEMKIAGDAASPVEMNHELVRTRGWSENPSEAPIHVVDSNGKDLGKASFFSSRDDVCYVRLKRFPSEGAEWIRLTGNLPMVVFAGEKTTEIESVRLEEGFEVKTDVFDLKVTEVEKKTRGDMGVVFHLTPKTGICKILRFDLTDKEGNKIEWRLLPPPFQKDTASADDPAMQRGFFKEHPGEMNISIMYALPSAFEAPVDVTFSLYTRDDQEQ